MDVVIFVSVVLLSLAVFLLIKAITFQSENDNSNDRPTCHINLNERSDESDVSSVYVTNQRVERWREEAKTILENLMSEYRRINGMRCTDLMDAHHAKERCLGYYDSYWELTRKYSDRIKWDDKDVDLWSTAKTRFINTFGQDQGIYFWGTEQAGRRSPRVQIDRKLTACIQ